MKPRETTVGEQVVNEFMVASSYQVVDVSPTGTADSRAFDRQQGVPTVRARSVASVWLAGRSVKRRRAGIVG